MAPKDGSSLWSHDLSRDLQKSRHEMDSVSDGILDGLAIALRLQSPFAALETFLCLVYIFTYRWGSV